ncbi:hypothetical protein ABH957_004689 [Bacillus sp. RC242]|uniref:BppU family phage baseplate upper protein n=1 Tax=Bacillus sp. RC242 TaxID=3156286 RepID=UPI003836D3D4
MTFKTRELTVDLVDEISTKEIRFSQGDKNSAKLVLNITNQGEELDLSKAIAVRITFRKPDGTTVFQEDLQPINAMKGKYQIILKTQTLAAAGNVYGQVRIFEKDQELDAEPFGFTVKQSYSGNGAVESTNEFTIIQKAIEAGEKLKGVDIDGIIAAGAKADAAVKKAGDRMTGVLELDNELRFNLPLNTQQLLFKGDGTATKSVWLAKSQEGIVIVAELTPGGGTRDWANAVYVGGSQNGVVKKTDIFSTYTRPDGRTNNINDQDLNNLIESGIYSGQRLANNPEGAAATSTFYYIEVSRHASVGFVKQVATTLATATPRVWVRVMNNTSWGPWIQQIDDRGGTVNGELTMAVDKNLSFKTGDYEFKHRAQLGNNKLIMQSVHPTEGNKFVWEYQGATNTFTMNADTNLLKKNGDTMTGSLYMDASTSNRSYGWRRADGKLHYIYGGADAVALFSEVTNKSAWQYTPSTDTFNVHAVNTNIVTKAKDGLANLTLTADATNANASYMPIADRRGNTVTVRMEITRNEGSANSLVCTLPTDMRPVNTLSFMCFSNDGTPVSVNVSWNGEINVFTAGKRIKLVATYVAN